MTKSVIVTYHWIMCLTSPAATYALERAKITLYLILKASKARVGTAFQSGHYRGLSKILYGFHFSSLTSPPALNILNFKFTAKQN